MSTPNDAKALDAAIQRLVARPGANTLAIDNWTGTANTVGNASTDRLVFDSDQTSNLNNFNFTGFAPGAVEFALGGGFLKSPHSAQCRNL